MTQKHMLTK